MSNPNGGHWFKLPQDPQYFNFAACSQVSENVRFFDSSDTADTFTHGDAICTIDCLFPHKNSILQLITFDSMVKSYRTCNNQAINSQTITCRDALMSNGFYLFHFPGDNFLQCFNDDARYSNIHVGNLIDRIKIYDITFGSPGLSADFSDPTDLYIPNGTGRYSGRLTDFSNPSVQGWVNNLNHEYLFEDVLSSCSFMNDLNQQTVIIDYCRATYSTALGGSTIVGPPGALSVIPTDQDRTPSMYNGCQYVLDISSSDTGNCTSIDTLCQNPAFKGNWRFGIPRNASASEILNLLPSHFCQSFFTGGVPSPSPGTIIPWIIPPVDNNPNNIFFAGRGVGDQNLLPSAQTQSNSAYIYRSCALKEYSGNQANCCANDFADGEGDIIFHPSISQAPRPGAGGTVGDQRLPLFGYDYATKGTPWYENCFDADGFTCDPAYRDITNESTCKPRMVSHCIGPDPTAVPESWASDSSGSGECMKWLGRLLYGNQGAWVQFPATVQIRGTLRDATGTKLTSDIIDLLVNNMSKFFTIQQLHTKQLSPIGEKLEPIMFALYKSYNLIFYDGGSVINQCGVFNINDVIDNPLLRRWCGCILQSHAYSSRYPGVSIECTPTCNSSDVLQVGIPCVGTECILDNITISIIDSQGGTASLSQVCNSCGKAVNNDNQQVRQTCSCIISNVDIEAINSRLGRIDIKEVCGLAGNGGSSALSPKPPVAERAVIAAKNSLQTFPFSVLSLMLISGFMGLFLVIYMRTHPDSKNWARILGISFLIIFLLALSAIIYYIVSFSL